MLYKFGFTLGGLLGFAIGVVCVLLKFMSVDFLFGCGVGVVICLILDFINWR